MAKETLQKVGWALIVVGLIDFGYMTYSIAEGLHYSSSFNIFAVIAGVFLLRQNLRAARIITWFAAFMLAGFVGAAVLFPLLTPFDLLMVQWRLNPMGMAAGVAIACAVLAFVYWVYRRLTSEPIMEARRSAGLDSRQPVSGFVVGACLAIGLFAIMAFVTHGAHAKEAVRRAQEQYGSNYRYHVTSLQWSGSGGRATLDAYNSREIREVHVKW